MRRSAAGGHRAGRRGGPGRTPALIGRRRRRPPTSSSSLPFSTPSASLASFVSLSRVRYVACGVSRFSCRHLLTERWCCDCECMCDARTVIEAWWITLIPSPCTKARAGNTAAAGMAGNTKTLRSNSGVRGTVRPPVENGHRILITSRSESLGSEKSRICLPQREATWPAPVKAPQGRGLRSRQPHRVPHTSGWRNLTTRHSPIQVFIFFNYNYLLLKETNIPIYQYKDSRLFPVEVDRNYKTPPTVLTYSFHLKNNIHVVIFCFCGRHTLRYRSKQVIYVEIPTNFWFYDKGFFDLTKSSYSPNEFNLI